MESRSTSENRQAEEGTKDTRVTSSFALGIKTLTWLNKEGQINLNKVCDILSSSMEYKTLIPIGNQQNQQQGIQRKVHVSFFSCPLGCGHSVPWGTLSGFYNFISITPQLRKDSVDKIKTSKCCLKTKGKMHDSSDCKSTFY